MKNRLFWKIVLVLLIFLWAMVHLGCSAAINKKMASWEGESANNLIAAWGPPDAVLDDGERGRYLFIPRKGLSPALAILPVTPPAQELR